MRRFVMHFIPDDFDYDTPDANPIMVHYLPLDVSDAQIAAVKDHGAEQVICTQIEERYGTHDFNADEKDEVLGYQSAEVAASDYAAVMQLWKGWLAAQGWNPGEVVILTEQDYADRFGIPSSIG
jgi:hypothetical protein